MADGEISGRQIERGSRRRVFISYSRKDISFAKRLQASLVERDYDAYLDIKDILPGEPWRDRLEGLIRSADSVAFIISPDSIASEICAWEVERSIELKKLLTPIHWRSAPSEAIPPALSARNFVFFDDFERSGMADDAALATALDKLDIALQLSDKLWVREHTKWVARAAEWDSAGREEGMLAPAGDIAAIDAWSRLKNDNALDYPEILVDYYVASKLKLEADSKRLRRTAGRAFVKPALQAIADGRHELALRLVGAGAMIADDIDFELVPDLWPAAAEAAIECRTKSVLRGHEGSVYDAAFSPDGKRVVTVGRGLEDNAIIWNAARSDKLITLEGHTNSVYAVAWSADGRFILTGSSDHTVRLWDADTGATVKIFRGHEGMIQHAELNRDGSRVLTYSKTYDSDPVTDRSVRLWDVATGRQIAKLLDREGQFDGEGQVVTHAGFSPDGEFCATVLHLHREVVVWRTADGSRIARIGPHPEYVHGFCFSPDGQLLAVACDDKTAVVWDIATTEQQAVMKGHSDSVDHVSFSPDGTTLLTRASDKSIRLWDVGTGKERVALGTTPHGYTNPAWSPDGSHIITVTDNVAFTWDAMTGQRTGAYREHDRYGREFRTWIRGLRFSADGRSVLTWGDDGTARVWDAAPSREALAFRHDHQVWKVRFSPDGEQLLSVCKDDTIHVWDAFDGTELSRLSAPTYAIWKSNFSTDGSRVAMIPNHYVTKEHTAAIYDSMSGELLVELRGHTSYIDVVIFSPDGTRLLTRGLDETVRLWDVATGEQLWSIDVVARTSVFSTDGAVIALSDGDMAFDMPSDNMVRLVSAKTSATLTTLEHDGPVHGIAFSPDGTRLAALVKGKKPTRLWLDVLVDPQEVVLEGHEGDDAKSLVFSPDGRSLLAMPFFSDQDERVLIWDAHSGAARTSLILRDSKNHVFSAQFSPDSRRIVTAGDETRIWDAERGVVIQRLPGRSADAVFCPEGLRLAAFQHDPTPCVRIWNVARSAVAMIDRAVLLTAALERGIGTYSQSDRADLLLADAPEHLAVEVGLHLAASAAATGRSRVELYLGVSDALAEPFEPGCYLAPSAFAELVGIPRAVDESPVKAAATPATTEETPQASSGGEASAQVAVAASETHEPSTSVRPQPAAETAVESQSNFVRLIVIGITLLAFVAAIAWTAS